MRWGNILHVKCWFFYTLHRLHKKKKTALYTRKGRKDYIHISHVFHPDFSSECESHVRHLLSMSNFFDNENMGLRLSLSLSKKFDSDNEYINPI
jgi:hypothetical protein